MSNNLRKLSSTIRPTSYVDYCDYLRALFNEQKAIDSEYSYAKFAHDLGYEAASNVHNIVMGRRPLTVKSATKISKELSLPSHQAQYFTLMVRLKGTKNPATRENALEELLKTRKRYDQGNLSGDQLELCKEWYHLVVRELLALDHLDQSPAAIAAIIIPKLRPVQVRKSIELLMRLNMVKYNAKTSRLEPAEDNVQTGAETEDLLAVRYHSAILDISKNAVAEIPEEDRDISANIFRVSRSQLQHIKKQIYDLQMSIMHNEAKVEDTDRIYQLNFQLFPTSVSLKAGNEDEDAKK